ncbi:MAG TPA: hypothetical protein VGL96_08680, partial [Casimicrobiaceae bacterium]
VASVVAALAGAGIAHDAIHAFDDVEKALAAARADVRDTDRIAAFGSFLTVAAVQDAMRNDRSREEGTR